jgi:hypothetical protein
MTEDISIIDISFRFYGVFDRLFFVFRASTILDESTHFDSFNRF